MQQALASTPVHAPFGPTALGAMAERAFVLRPPATHEKKHVLRNEAAILLDRLLTRVARSRGALDVAIGERLVALGLGDRVLRLGFSGIGDYGRERLGMSARMAQQLAHLARELRDRPLLAQAVREGTVSARKAATVLRVARGDDEAPWLERARVETVRALDAAVTEAAAASSGAGTHGEDEERWEDVCVPMSREQRAAVDEAMELAGKVLGPTAPRWQRLEALCSEFLAAHAGDAPEGADGFLHWPAPRGWLEEAKKALEEQTRRWAFLDRLSPVEPVAAPADVVPDDPACLDAELRELGALCDGWDEVMGHLAMLMKMLGLWRDAQFATFDQYCAERLGMATRTVEQRAWLARRLYALPELREALRSGRVSYEKARIIATHADDASVARWIEQGEKLTCIELRREADAHEERQMRARGELDLRVPRHVLALVSTAFRALRVGSERWIPPEECLVRIALHFIEAWKDAVPKPRTPEAKAIARDGGLCQVPGCSRAAAHAHHIHFRSAGGGDESANLVGLCAAHHLVAIHRGHLRVRGEAPARLRWELIDHRFAASCLIP